MNTQPKLPALSTRAICDALLLFPSQNDPEARQVELLQRNAERVQIFANEFFPFTTRVYATGTIVRVDTKLTDKSLEAALSKDGKGKILVVDNCGRQDCAVVQRSHFELAVKCGWQALLINGCVRANAALTNLTSYNATTKTNGASLVVRARGAHPATWWYRHPDSFESSGYAPMPDFVGDYMVMDADGVVVTSRKILHKAGLLNPS